MVDGGCFVDWFDDEWGCVAESSFGRILEKRMRGKDEREGGVVWSV
jgi:hypothetical protein